MSAAPASHRDELRDRLVSDIAGLLYELVGNSAESLDASLPARRRARKTVEHAWRSMPPEERARMLASIVKRMDCALRGVLRSLLEERVARLGPERTTLHTEIESVGLGNEEVGPGRTAYGVRVRIRSDSGARLEVGAGVIPDLPSGAELLESENPVETAVRADRIQGGGVWVKLSY